MGMLCTPWRVHHLLGAARSCWAALCPTVLSLGTGGQDSTCWGAGAARELGAKARDTPNGCLEFVLGPRENASKKNTVRIGHCIRDTTLQDRAFCCWPVRSCSLTSQFLLAWACARNQKCTYGLCCFLVRLWKLLYVNSVLRTTSISCYIGKIPLAGLPQKQFVWVN